MKQLPAQSSDPPPELRSRRKTVGLALLAGIAVLLLASIVTARTHHQSSKAGATLAHSNITTTVFWVGEPGDADNANIPNASSTWVEQWQDAYGGVDDPAHRCGLLPCGFTPQENAFYFALPYNDLNTSCDFKDSQQDVPWFNSAPVHGHSIIKNHWIKVEYKGKTAYAQWEDAGPLGEDDTSYVFGSAQPHYKKSGLDLSPATADYLGIDGKGQTSWQFVDQQDVPGGPWKQTVTTSLPDCA